MRASKLAFGIVCGPIICCYVVFAACCCPGRLRRYSESEEKKRFERRQKVSPRPLPVRPLERSLTIPVPIREPEKSLSPTSQHKRGVTVEQTESRLMSLPLELREMIFKAVVGDKAMHMVLKENKLGYLKCKSPDPSRCALGFNGRTLSRECCWGIVDSANIWKSNRRSKDRVETDGDIVPFLQTCRQIYSESINFLYSSNTFSFSDLDCLRYFSCTILPKRFSLIQTLDLEWCLSWPIYDPIAQHLLSVTPAFYPPNDEATWEATWQIIAEMPNLKFIRVSLLYFDGWRDPASEEKMLAPLMKVTKPKTFEVHVSWRGQDIEGAPFQLIRPAPIDLDADSDSNSDSDSDDDA